jgi:hypothetical protein
MEFWVLVRRGVFIGCILSLLLTSPLATEPAQARHMFQPSPALFSRGFDVPLPPPRPPDLTPSSRTAAPETAGPDPACTLALASGKLVATSVPPVTGPDGCGIAAPLKLDAIILADGSRVPMEPPAIIRCALAEALGDWVHDDMAPLAQKAGGGLSKILGSEGYECRPRNRVEGAKLSEHGKGNAYDLLGVVLRDGRHLLIEHQTDATDFMTELKAAACARFTTVLGPGSDGYHENHLHVDLAERHSGYRICQWELK